MLANVFQSNILQLQHFLKCDFAVSGIVPFLFGLSLLLSAFFSLNLFYLELRRMTNRQNQFQSADWLRFEVLQTKCWIKWTEFWDISESRQLCWCFNNLAWKPLYWNSNCVQRSNHEIVLLNCSFQCPYMRVLMFEMFKCSYMLCF